MIIFPPTEPIALIVLLFGFLVPFIILGLLMKIGSFATNQSIKKTKRLGRKFGRPYKTDMRILCQNVIKVLEFQKHQDIKTVKSDEYNSILESSTNIILITKWLEINYWNKFTNSLKKPLIVFSCGIADRELFPYSNTAEWHDEDSILRLFEKS